MPRDMRKRTGTFVRRGMSNSGDSLAWQMAMRARVAAPLNVARNRKDIPAPHPQAGHSFTAMGIQAIE